VIGRMRTWGKLAGVGVEGFGNLQCEFPVGVSQPTPGGVRWLGSRARARPVAPHRRAKARPAACTLGPCSRAWGGMRYGLGVATDDERASAFARRMAARPSLKRSRVCSGARAARRDSTTLIHESRARLRPPHGAQSNTAGDRLFTGTVPISSTCA